MDIGEGNIFSIIIPTYNSGKTLSISLDSIAIQTNKRVEVIIMDGASKDNTLTIAEGFKDTITSLKIYSEKDNGVYDAMNKAMDITTGKWLFFMGSDDRFYDECILETMANYLQNSNSKVLYGNVKIVGDAGWAKDGTLYDGEFDIHKLLNQNICHQSMFYNAKFVKEEIGYFNLKYPVISDWDFNLRCWAKLPFEFIELTISYFVAGGVSTHGNDVAFANDRIDNIIKYFAIDAFDPLICTPKFSCYKELLKKQRDEHPLRFQINRLKKRFKK